MSRYNDNGYNHDGLRVDLQELRNSIDVNSKRWKHFLTTNCYAFALGLDIKEKDIKNYAFQPGVIGSSFNSIDRLKFFSYSSLIDNIHIDMEKLGIDIREVDPLEEVSDGEWKIALFTVFHAYRFYSEWLSDFHFLRQSKEGIWYHKPGYYNIPTKYDYKHQIIQNPENCYLNNKQYRKCYSLKLR